MATMLRAGRTGVRIPVWEGNVLISQKSRPALWAHPAPTANGYRGSFPVGKATET